MWLLDDDVCPTCLENKRQLGCISEFHIKYEKIKETQNALRNDYQWIQIFRTTSWSGCPIPSGFPTGYPF